MTTPSAFVLGRMRRGPRGRNTIQRFDPGFRATREVARAARDAATTGSACIDRRRAHQVRKGPAELPRVRRDRPSSGTAVGLVVSRIEELLPPKSRQDQSDSNRITRRPSESFAKRDDESSSPGRSSPSSIQRKVVQRAVSRLASAPHSESERWRTSSNRSGTRCCAPPPSGHVAAERIRGSRRARRRRRKCERRCRRRPATEFRRAWRCGRRPNPHPRADPTPRAAIPFERASPAEVGRFEQILERGWHSARLHRTSTIRDQKPTHEHQDPSLS